MDSNQFNIADMSLGEHDKLKALCLISLPRNQGKFDDAAAAAFPALRK